MGRLGNCLCHRWPLPTPVTHTHSLSRIHMRMHHKDKWSQCLAKTRKCGYLRCQAPGSTDPGSYCPSLFLPSFPLSIYNSNALPVGSPSPTVVSQCCICLRYANIGTKKACDFTQKLTKALRCCSNNNFPTVQQSLLWGIFQCLMW